MGAFISIICSKIGCQDNNMLREEEQGEAKQYSWDTRKKVDPKDFTIENLDGETVGRLPGSIDGQQFIIQKCTNCTILLYDNIATISVDDCVNCKIFIGPVKTSVFIRDCSKCEVMLSCQQFRTRDCKDLRVYLSCVSQPIIEASTSMQFGCFSFFYPQLKDQFKAAGLTAFNNNWYNVHDFTPSNLSANFSLIQQKTSQHDEFACTTGIFSNMEFDLSGSKWVVPTTHSEKFSEMTNVVLVVFFRDDLIYDRVAQFIDAVASTSSRHAVQALGDPGTGGPPPPKLVLSKETVMQQVDASKVLNSNDYNKYLQAGAVVALVYSGVFDVHSSDFDDDCLRYVSSDSKEASRQVERFVGFSDMQMGF